jgi:hypothetical protein
MPVGSSKEIDSREDVSEAKIDTIDAFHDVPSVDSADNVVMSDVLGNKSDTKNGDSVVALVKNNGQIPATDSATNTLVRDVVGSKDDTKNGTSLYAKHEDLLEKTTFPTQDLATNATFAQVVGNKTDTVGGTSIIALAKQIVEDTGTTIPGTITTIDAFHDVPAQNSADNVVMSDVIGNKTDTDDGDSIYSMCTTISTIDTALMAGKSAGTFSYLDAGGEQTIVEYTPAADTGTVIRGIWLDLVNMTQNGTIKIYYKIDGSNYREVESFSFTVATDSDGFLMDRVFGIQSDFKVTYTEGADEGAARSLPFEIIYQISDGAWG